VTRLTSSCCDITSGQVTGRQSNNCENPEQLYKKPRPRQCGENATQLSPELVCAYSGVKLPPESTV